MRMSLIIQLGVMLAVVSVAGADGLARKGQERSITLPPSQVDLKPGTGMEVTRSYCSICHSLDYITTQPKFPLARWQAEVTKMIKVYGAPVNEPNAKLIAEYISHAYGKGE
jgi:mono/diheme cytochrome c family protein